MPFQTSPITCRFGPLRNALLVGLLLAVGLVLEALDALEALAIAACMLAIPVGARYLAQGPGRSSSASTRSASRG